MPSIYAVCPHCVYIEVVSDHCSTIMHAHDGLLFMLILVRTKAEAHALVDKWRDDGPRVARYRDPNRDPGLE